MDRQDHLITELPTLSDRSASDLLDLLNALFNSLDSQCMTFKASCRTPRLLLAQISRSPECVVVGALSWIFPCPR